MKKLSNLKILIYTIIYVMFIIFMINTALASVNIKDVKVVYNKLCIANNGCPKLIIVKSSKINAMATTDGIVIFTGMLKFLDNRDQLAIVLSHELGHITKRDPYNPWHTFNMEYHADQYGANLTTKARFNRCKGLKYFNKTMKYFGDGTSLNHPMNSLRLQRINYNCKRGK